MYPLIIPSIWTLIMRAIFEMSKNDAANTGATTPLAATASATSGNGNKPDSLRAMVSRLEQRLAQVPPPLTITSLALAWAHAVNGVV